MFVEIPQEFTIHYAESIHFFPPVQNLSLFLVKRYPNCFHGKGHSYGQTRRDKSVFFLKILSVSLEGSLFHHSLTSQPCWCPLRWKSAHGKTCRCIFRTALDLVVFVVRFLFLLSSMRRYNSSATNCVERVAFDHSGCGITFVMQ